MVMVDMAHYSGLVAAGELDSPFKLADVVTTTTHKSLRGPRAGMIFFRRGPKPAHALKRGEEAGKAAYDYEDRINFSVFPSLQGGPHNHQIGALAVALRQAASPSFKAYARAVVANARALADELVQRGYTLVTGGTDNHLVLWDLRPAGLTGSKVEAACDRCHITLNKNAVVGDASALAPGGVRLGSPAMTSRGLDEADFRVVAGFLDEVVQECQALQAAHGKMLAAFTKALDASDKLRDIRERVETWSTRFPMPGFDVSALL